MNRNRNQTERPEHGEGLNELTLGRMVSVELTKEERDFALLQAAASKSGHRMRDDQTIWVRCRQSQDQCTVDFACIEDATSGASE